MLKFEHQEHAEAEKTGRAAPATELQLAVLQEMPQEAVEVWDEPITEELKDWTMKYFEGLMQKNHGGWFTQEAAEALTTRDRNVQRKVQKLEMKAADLAWAWVAHKRQQGHTIGEVWRPELGGLRTPQVLWELQAQAITGWNMDVRQLITKEVLRKVVLSRKVLESIHRFAAKGRATRQGVSEEELPDMELGAVMMTPHLAQLVWGNDIVKKLGGLTGKHAIGKRRYWACIHILLWEGVIEGDMGQHYRDIEWEGMASEGRSRGFQQKKRGFPEGSGSQGTARGFGFLGLWWLF